MQYQLLDSGGAQKLERFGPVVLVRPCAQAVWKPAQPAAAWQAADATFTRYPAHQWRGRVPREWVIEYDRLRFKLMPTDFGHVGLFPEHRELWSWVRSKLTREATILNLFAYTGGATLACAKEGAQVCHVDASKVSVDWARHNAGLNGLTEVRWIVDDVIGFLKREVRRSRSYDGIILDPPTFGRGSRGEVFKIEEHLGEILSLCYALLSKNPLFVVLSTHTPGYTPTVLHHMLHQAAPRGCIEAGELTIAGPLTLPSGAYARWYAP